MDYLWFSSQNIIYDASGITLFSLDTSCDGLSSAKNMVPQLTLVPSKADEKSPGLYTHPVNGGAAFSNVDNNPSYDFFESTAYKGACGESLCLGSWSWLSDNYKLASIEACGDIEADTTWASNVRMTCQVFVQAEVTLTIQSGAQS